MSGRQSKKIRQLYRRDFKETAEREALAYAKHYASSIKPKPWYIPGWLWDRMLRMIIAI